MSQHKIQSKTNPSIWYTVTEESCTCPDYMYRKRHYGGHCKHMRQIVREQCTQNLDDMTQQVVEANVVHAKQQEAHLYDHVVRAAYTKAESLI